MLGNNLTGDADSRESRKSERTGLKPIKRCGGRQIPIRYEREGDCFVCTSHAKNRDGYIRIRYNGRLTMLHRLVLQMRGLAIPEGYEVDHLCRNRACSNPQHLAIKTRKQHLTETNQHRYAGRKEIARLYWHANPSTSGTLLADAFGVEEGTAYRWIREWKQAITH